ncbi:hypothetical protein F7725_023958 [Dissostichus mawsoni]|uniref:Uncharacterized protein n=1 Tax=Dissostichus mawsoni TaxID=36200 RepID=A0A7J5XZV7_DISMA|nr:hypothetical protein F7725_023958 [Dissostichus mawsoni]
MGRSLTHSGRTVLRCHSAEGGRSEGESERESEREEQARERETKGERKGKLCVIVAQTRYGLTLAIVSTSEHTFATEERIPPQERPGLHHLKLFMPDKVYEHRGRGEEIQTRLHTFR